MSKVYEFTNEETGDKSIVDTFEIVKVEKITNGMLAITDEESVMMIVEEPSLIAEDHLIWVDDKGNSGLYPKFQWFAHVKSLEAMGVTHTITDTSIKTVEPVIDYFKCKYVR